jgi:hypothetical protein
MSRVFFLYRDSVKRYAVLEIQFVVHGCQCHYVYFGRRAGPRIFFTLVFDFPYNTLTASDPDFSEAITPISSPLERRFMNCLYCFLSYISLDSEILDHLIGARVLFIITTFMNGEVYRMFNLIPTRMA